MQASVPRRILGIFILFTVLILSGCKMLDSLSFNPSPVTADELAKYVTHDVIRNSYKMTCQMDHHWTTERSRYFISQNSIWTKEQLSSGREMYTIYVRMNVTEHSYPLTDSLYLIGDKKFLALPLQREKSELLNSYSVQKARIRTFDSTMVEVVTGITLDQDQFELFKCQIDASAMEALKGSEALTMRYYMGPYSITVPLKTKEFQWLMAVIDMDLGQSYEDFWQSGKR